MVCNTGMILHNSDIRIFRRFFASSNFIMLHFYLAYVTYSGIRSGSFKHTAYISLGHLMALKMPK